MWFGELAEVRGEVEPEPFSSSGERHSTDEDDEEQQVGECGGEVDHLHRKKPQRFLSSPRQRAV